MHTGAAARYLNGKFLSKYTSIFRKSWKETAQEVTMQCEYKLNLNFKIQYSH